MLLDVLSSFTISYELSYFAPVPKTVSWSRIKLLLEAFKKQEFLFSSPFAVKDREIKPVNNMVFVGSIIKVGKAAETVVRVIGQDFGDFADVFFADIALDLVGGVYDILKKGKKYIKIAFVETGSVQWGLELGLGFAWGLLVALDKEFPGNEKKGT